MFSKKLILLCVAFLFWSASRANVQKKEQLEILDTIEHEDGLVFKTVNGRTLEMIYFKPQNATPSDTVPWMLFVHGGGWRGGNRYVILKASFQETLRELTDKGVAVFSIEYRLTRNGITAYDSVVDCKDAARFLLKNATTFNLDTERYGVMGGSAGGHLSLMTALGRDRDFPGGELLTGVTLNFKCVASYFPLSTMLNRDVLIGSRFEDPEALRHVLDGLFSEKQELARLLSPTEYLSSETQPILLLHGDADPTLDIKNSHYMMEVAEAKGAAVELLTVKNGGHNFSGDNISPNMSEVNEAAAQFILSHLK
ncbi:alpha/beta hydrolase fold domain-containing protein [Puniceicoccaceae bacterium K14]|nr:alpha/beta hydrolase fold domain-containing protein [Puniceicoccaceae bacterium K14]